MFALPIGLGPMAVRDGLGEVLREVAHRPVRVGRAGEHAPGVDLDSEPGHVRRLLDRVRRLIPGRQRFARLRVDVHLPVGVPGREDAVVDDPVALRPPHLVVGRGGDLPQFDPGDRPSQREVDVRRQPALRLDRGEVLHVPADEPAQVLHEPVHRPGEVQSISRSTDVVVSVGVDRRPIAPHRSVRVERRGDEERWPEPIAVHPSDRAGVDASARKLRHVLPPAG